MARVFVTGSTTGLCAAAARQLLDDRHGVVLHARNPQRTVDVDDLARRAAGVVVGDFSSIDETRDVADQANAIGGVDAARTFDPTERARITEARQRLTHRPTDTATPPDRRTPAVHASRQARPPSG